MKRKPKIRKYYYYSRVTGLHKFDDFNKIPTYMKKEVYESEDEAYANFLSRKNKELKIKIENSERKIRNFKTQIKDNEKDFGYTKELFPEIFV